SVAVLIVTVPLDGNDPPVSLNEVSVEDDALVLDALHDLVRGAIKLGDVDRHEWILVIALDEGALLVRVVDCRHTRRAVGRLRASLDVPALATNCGGRHNFNQFI